MESTDVLSYDGEKERFMISYCFKNAPTIPEMVPIAHHRYVHICAAILLPVEKLEVTKFQTQFAVALMIRFYL